MFIKLDSYIIPVDNIVYIKLIGAGADIFLKSSQTPLKISNIPERDLELALDKLFLRRKDLNT